MKILFLLFFISTFVQAKELDIKSFIKSFKKYDVRQEAILSELMRTRFNQDLNLPGRQWLLELNTEYGIELDGGVQTSTQSLGLSRNNRATGTDVSVSFQENNQIGREEKTQSIRIEQSLIQNSFGAQFRVNKDLLEKRNQVINLQVSESYEDYLAERINQYLSFVQDYKTLETTKSLYNLALKLKREVELRKKKNIANQVDVDRISVQVLERKMAVNTAQKNLDITIQDLKDSLSEEAFNDFNFVPPSNIPYLSEEIKINLDLFWEKSRTAMLLNKQSEAAGKQILVQKYNLYPEARIILGLNRDDSQRFNARANREEAVVGVNLSYAFDNTLQKARLDQAKLERVQATYEVKRARKVIKNQLMSLYKKIVAEKNQILLLKKQLKLSKRLTKGEKGNFIRGRSNLSDVINAQNILANTELELLGQKILLARSVVSWLRVNDALHVL